MIVGGIPVLLGGGGIQYISSSKNWSTSQSSTLIINKPSNLLVGDIIVVFLIIDAGDNVYWTLPAGWVGIGGAINAPDSMAGNGPPPACAYYIIAGGEGATFTFTTNNNKDISGIIAAYRGAKFNKAGAINAQAGTNATAVPTYNLDSLELANFLSKKKNSTPTTFSTPANANIVDFISNTFGGANYLFSRFPGKSLNIQSNPTNGQNETSYIVNLAPLNGHFATSISGWTSGIKLLNVSPNQINILSGVGTVTGQTTPVSVVVVPSGVTYSINGGAYGSVGTVVNGDTLEFMAATGPADWDNTTDNRAIRVGDSDYTWQIRTPTYYSFSGTSSFIVPVGVTSLSTLCHSDGGNSSVVANSGGGGAAGLSYSNSIAVTPGETLTITVTSGSLVSIARGATILVKSNSGAASTSTVGGLKGAVGVGVVNLTGGNGANSGGGGNSPTLASGSITTTAGRDATTLIGDGGSGATYSSTGWIAVNGTGGGVGPGIGRGGGGGGGSGNSGVSASAIDARCIILLNARIFSSLATY